MEVNFGRLSAPFAKLGMLFASLLGVLAVFFFPGTGIQLFLISVAMVVFANSFAQRARISWRAKKARIRSDKNISSILVALNITLIVELSFLLLMDDLLIMTVTMLAILAESIALVVFLLRTTFGLTRNQVLFKTATVIGTKAPPLLTVRRGSEPALTFGGTVGIFASIGYWLQSHALTATLIIFFIVFALVSLVTHFSLRSISPQFKFYDDRFRLVQAGTVRLEKGYSDIASIELRGRKLFGPRILIHGKESEDNPGVKHGNILAIIPSNPKKRILGDIRLYDWLESRIGTR